MITLDRPPLTEDRKEWADWFFKVWTIMSSLQTPIKTDATRGGADEPGRVIYNEDDGQLNIADGTNWTLPDGTTT